MKYRFIVYKSYNHWYSCPIAWREDERVHYPITQHATQKDAFEQACIDSKTDYYRI